MHPRKILAGLGALVVAATAAIVPLSVSSSAATVPLLGSYDGAANPAGVSAFGSETGTTPSIYSDYAAGENETWTNWSNTIAWLIPQLKGKVGSERLELSVPLASGGYSSQAAAMAAFAANPSTFNANMASLAQTLVSNGFSNAIIRLMWEPQELGLYSNDDLTSAANYAALFRDAHTAMAAVSGASVQWAWYWEANFDSSTNNAAYPGNAYVDYVTNDFYDQSWVTSCGVPYNGAAFTATQDNCIWNAPNGYAATLKSLTNFAATVQKPIGIGEWGVISRGDNHGGNDDPTFINLYTSWLKANNVAWASYFDFNDDGLNSTLSAFPNSLAAFRADLGNGSGSGGGSATATTTTTTQPHRTTTTTTAPTTTSTTTGGAHSIGSGSSQSTPAPGGSLAGGSITLSKSSALIGGSAVKVSGSGWTASGDSSVTINECATASYAAASCDTTNQVAAPLGTRARAGKFTNSAITVATGNIDANHDTCGMTTPSPCYIVVRGDAGDLTASTPLGFTTPSLIARKATAVLGNSIDRLVSTGLPRGDSVVAEECDAQVSVPSTVATNCDPATTISGTVSPSGRALFTPNGITLKEGAAYSDSAGGTCFDGDTCEIVVRDTNDPSIALSTPFTFAPLLASAKMTASVPANAMDRIVVSSFPVGDTVTAEECDAAVDPASTVATNCDPSTGTSSTVNRGGRAPLALTVVADSSYVESGSGSGSVSAGGTAILLVTDATLGESVEVPITLAS